MSTEIHFLIMADEDGGTAYLTNQSSASSYGIPVLQVSADDIDGDFGPADIIGNMDDLGDLIPAATVIAAWANNPERTVEELEAARLFLQQWPEGPQI
jgi:hypothetical protein